MKVLFVIDSLANSGTEKSLLDIISNFSKSVTPLVVYLKSPETLKQQYVDAGINVINLNNFTNIFTCYKSLKQIIDTEKPDLIVSSLYKSSIICRLICLGKKTKLVGTFVSDSYNKLRLKNYNSKQKIGHYLFKFLDRITAGIPNAFISNSKSIKLTNCKYLGINKNKVKVIYRGRNSNDISQWSKPNSDKFIFIIVARVLETKGYKELIEAMSEISSSFKNIELYVYGDGNYMNELQQQIKKSNIEKSIIFKGNILQAYKYLSTANCFIFPSWYEGISGALIEASISGIPIIASDIPMNKEVINTLPTSITHKVQSAKSIANAMFEMMNNYDYYTSQTTIARKIAIDKFDIKNIAAKYESFLLSI